MVIHQFDCFCEASYIGITSRKLGKRVKQHMSIELICISEEKESKLTQVLNALTFSSVVEHLLIHPTRANNYNVDRFKINKSCNNIFDSIKLKAICILSRKPNLCKHRNFDYTVSLFS